MPALKALSLWYGKNEVPTMIGLLMSVGNLGAIIATTPLAWTAATWGWRLTFYLIAAVTLVLAFATLLFTRDHPESNRAPRTAAAGGKAVGPDKKPSAIQVLSSVQFWIIAVIFFGIYGTLITLQGLWATPFLVAVLGIERLFASKLNMLIPIGVIAGAPVIGWLLNRFAFDKRKTLIAMLAVYALAWLVIVGGAQTPGSLAATFVILGFVGGGFISTLWGILRDMTPPELMGLTSGLLNIAPIVGIAFFQLITGIILDRAGAVAGLYPAAGFQNAFLACLAGIVLCLGLAFAIRKRA